MNQETYCDCCLPASILLLVERKCYEPKTGGAAIDCYHDEEGNNVYKYTRKLHHGHKAKLERQLIEFMIGLQDTVKEHIPRVPLQTKHTWCGETFRAHTWFCGTIWRDWVFIDWGNDGGELPSKISSLGFQVNYQILSK
jgi:hypothetical protein